MLIASSVSMFVFLCSLLLALYVTIILILSAFVKVTHHLFSNFPKVVVNRYPVKTYVDAAPPLCAPSYTAHKGKGRLVHPLLCPPLHIPHRRLDRVIHLPSTGVCVVVCVWCVW
jgi:hypothetical protein